MQRSLVALLPVMLLSSACDGGRTVPSNPSGGHRDAGANGDGGSNPSDGGGAHDAGNVGQTCTNDQTCGGARCDRLSGRCVECRTTADCAGASRCVDHRCQASPSCSSDLDCTSMSLVCDLVGHRCAECNSAADCMDGACLDHSCYASKACTSSLDCRDLRSVCGPALPPAWPT
ncbi:MAG: hypothetical protein U1E65_35910, partial [Myxococcota bacterium]